MTANRTRRRRLLLLGALAALFGYRQYRLAHAPDPAGDLPPSPG